MKRYQWQCDGCGWVIRRDTKAAIALPIASHRCGEEPIAPVYPPPPHGSPCRGCGRPLNMGRPPTQEGWGLHSGRGICCACAAHAFDSKATAENTGLTGFLARRKARGVPEMGWGVEG